MKLFMVLTGSLIILSIYVYMFIMLSDNINRASKEYANHICEQTKCDIDKDKLRY